MFSEFSLGDADKFFCQVCGADFQSEKKLKSHQISCRNVQKQQLVAGQKLPCEFCKNLFTKIGLPKHQKACKSRSAPQQQEEIKQETIQFPVVSPVFEQIVFESEENTECDLSEISLIIDELINKVVDQSFIQSTVSNCSHNLSCKCGRKLIIENGEIIDNTPQHEQFDKVAIQQVDLEKTNNIPSKIYDFSIDLTNKGFDLICYAENKIVVNSDIQLLYTDEKQIFKPVQYEYLDQHAYRQITNIEHNQSCPPISRSKAFKLKLTAELSVANTFVFPEKHQIIYWDIETFNAGQYNEVPQPENNYSFIGMIQYLIINEKGEVNSGILTRKSYQIDELTVEANQIAPLYNQKKYKFEIQYFSTERQICDAFIKILSKDKTIPKFLIGFNSSASIKFQLNADQQSQINYNEAYGYDLNWLQKRCSYILTPQNCQYKASADLTFNLTKGFKEIQNLYIHDAMALFAQQMSADDLKNLPNRSLDSFLTMFKIPNKLDHNYYNLQKQLHLADQNITEIVEYAIYDCICLDIAFTNRSIFSKLQGEMEMWNCPLSFTLYETANTKNQVMIQRQLIKQNLQAPYLPPEEQSQENFKGAFTFTNDQYILNVISNALCHDFASLYPSTIIGFNICISTHCIDPVQEFGEDWRKFVNIIDCTDDKTIGTHLYFYKPEYKMGLIPQICFDILNIRSQLKKQQKEYEMQRNRTVKNSEEFLRLDNLIRVYENKQLAYKVANNSIFGGLGSKFSPFYYKYFSAAVTAQARRCLQRLMAIIEEQFGLYNGQTRLICGDTDSVFWIADDLLQQGENRKDQFYKIENIINSELHKTFPHNISVCAEEILVKFCPSKAKKSYYRLEQNLADFFDYNDQLDKLKLVVKGVQWSSLDVKARDSLKSLFKQHLLSNNADINELIADHIQQIETLIENAIINKDVQTIQEYAKRIKVAGKNKQSKYIKDNYPDIISDFCYIVPILYSGRQGSEAIVPIQHLSNSLFNMIDFNQFLKAYKQQINKFFISKDEQKQGKLKNQLKQIYDSEQLDVDQCIFRIEQVKNKLINMDLAVLTLQQAYKLGEDEKKKLSIHEIIHSSYNKMYFDIDEQINLAQLKADIAKWLFQNGIQHDLQLYIATCHRKDKFSYHITGNLVLHKRMMIMLAEYLRNQQHPIDMKPYLDQGAYRSLRFVNCIKIKDCQYDKNRFTTNATLEQISVTYTHGFRQIMLPPVFDNQHIFQFNNGISINHPNSKILQILQNRLPQADFQQKDRNLFAFTYKNEAHICEICNKTHSSLRYQGYVSVQKERLVIKCYKDTTNKNQIILPIELSEEQREQMNKFNHHIEFVEEFIPNQNKKLVKFDFIQEYEMLAVKSAMGTGKTEQTIQILKKQLENGVQSAVIASARVVFSNNAQTRFNQNKDGSPTGLNVRQYTEYKGLIHPNESMTIVQVESFTRLADEPFELLVLDEFQSIYEQLNSGLHKNTNQLHYKFIQLLSKAKRILVLDSQLKASTLARLEFFAGRKARVINNIYKPYSDFTFVIHPFKGKNDIDEMFDLCKDSLDKGFKIYSHINAKSKLFALTKHLENAKHSVRNYHGDNLLVEQDNQIHGKIKDTHFRDVEKYFKQYNAVLCNSAMGAGVDFSKDHFDLGVHAFFANTASPMAFVQSLFRSRKFTQKEHHVWIQLQENNQSLSTNQYFNQKKLNNDQINVQAIPTDDKTFNLQMDLEAYKNAMNSNRANIIISNLKDLGCKIVVAETVKENEACQLYKKLQKELPKLELSTKNMKEIDISVECVKYFLADPNLKQEMIKNGDLSGNIKQQIQALSLTVINKSISNKQLQNVDQAYQLITDKWREIKELSEEELKEQYKIYELSKIYREYKKAFGVIHHLSQQEQCNVVDQKIEQIAQMYKSNIPLKGFTFPKLLEMSKKVKKAIQYYWTPNDQKEAAALELFKYKRDHYKFIYSILGLNYTATFKKVRNGKKLENVLDSISITHLPNAQINQV